jgi:hypothetical protein
VAIVVEDIENLYGLDVQLNWTTTFIKYKSHVTTIPVENYPDPIPPSPYAGILHADTMKVKDVVSETAPIPGSEVGTMGWWAYSSMAPAEPFSGSGTVVVITFRLEYQPYDYEAPNGVDAVIHFVASTFSTPGGVPIPHTRQDVVIHIWPRKFTYPPVPLLKLVPASYKATALGETFTFDIYLLGFDLTKGEETDLNSFWDVAGFDIYINFNPSLIEAENAEIDPAGWFASFWPGGVFTVLNKINNTEGWVHIVFLGIPDLGGVHTPPFGQGKLATITFKATYLHLGYPPPTCTISLKNPEPRPSYNGWGPDLFPVDIAGFPHPERPMAPWNGTESAVPVPHKVKSATYTAPYKVLGAQIDVYTQYSYPYGGQEPGKPSDLFTPQQMVILYAKVTYNMWPEQKKPVTFQIIDPHGDTYIVASSTTDANGIATYSFRLPWMCDDPEYYLGTWEVIATTEVAEQVVTDTLQFKYDYLVRIWKTTTDKTEYDHFETITVTIEYGSAAMQTYDVLISVLAKDETGVPFDWDKTWITVGGAEWCTYANNTVTLTLYIPKWARSGEATIEVSALTNYPALGGTALYPTDEAHNTIIKFGIKLPA